MRANPSMSDGRLHLEGPRPERPWRLPTKVGSDTALAQIIKLVQDAQNSKAPAQLLVDRASQWLVLVLAAIVIGLVTFAIWFWWIDQSLLFALTLTITVFVIACPDALGLATPMAIMIGTGMGARHGILFKHADAIEGSARLDMVIFDETGTLTFGQPEVVEIAAAPDRTEAELLALAAAVEAHSEHPLARAILDRAGSVTERADAFTNIDGQGATGLVGGRKVLLGNRKLMDDAGIAMESLQDAGARLQGAGRVAYVGRDQKLVGLFAIADAIRPSSLATINEPHARGVKVAMITGDNRPTAERVAAELGIDIVPADVLPGGKVDEVPNVRNRHHVVVALFDMRSGRRITDAKVVARLRGPAGPPVVKPLDPMQVGGAMSYGNVFVISELPGHCFDLELSRGGQPSEHFPFSYHPDH